MAVLNTNVNPHKKYNINAPIKVDAWLLVTVGTGVQIKKNGYNVAFALDFDRAWNHVVKNGTKGDTIELQINGTL